MKLRSYVVVLLAVILVVTFSTAAFAQESPSDSGQEGPSNHLDSMGGLSIVV